MIRETKSQIECPNCSKVQAEAQVEARKARARIAELEAVLSQYADPENWGYYDESGCPKGYGQSEDACFVERLVAVNALKGAGGK